MTTVLQHMQSGCVEEQNNINLTIAIWKITIFALWNTPVKDHLNTEYIIGDFSLYPTLDS